MHLIPPLAYRMAFALLFTVVAVPALSTSPMIDPPVEMWTRTADGDVIYIAQRENRLSALCIQAGRQASWLPADLLEDITHPAVRDAELVRGMGFSHIDQHVPHWGAWGLSVSVPTAAEEKDTFVGGPAYFFVLHQGRPVFRVEQRSLPASDDPRFHQSTEIWLPVPAGSLRHAPCQPTSPSSTTPSDH